jgi:hypothetical protein
MKTIFKLSVLPLALFVSCESVNAAKLGAYFGGGAGFGTAQEVDGFIKENDNAFAGRVFFGYNFNRYLGIETSYSAFDTIKFLNIDYPQISGNLSYNAVSLVGKIYGPSSNDRFNLYALLGVAQVYNKLEAIYNRRTELSWSDNGIVPTAGLGVSYDINPHFTMAMELSGFGEKESFDNIGILSSGLATLNLAYTF